ncbi:MAG: smt [Chitinophagaceae bacterium]|nr:smt [Chitinophagaceae bacterium]
MASVHSPIRDFLKPILFKLFGKNLYVWFQYKAKIKDIDHRLVEEAEMVLLNHFCKDDAESIDIGANFAYHTERMARLSKKVYAFEPIPFTYKVCKMIVDHYKLRNVELYNLGVGQHTEIKTFSIPVVDFGAFSSGQAHMSERNNELEGKEQHYKFHKNQVFNCQVVDLDTFLEKKLKKLSYIKMDIEGAELFALKGMTKILAVHKPVVLLEINPFFLKGFGIAKQEMKNLIHSLNYDTFVYDTAQGKLISYEKDYVESNYILIHRDRKTDFSSIIS